jgi:hypothetical protein
MSDDRITDEVLRLLRGISREPVLTRITHAYPDLIMAIQRRCTVSDPTRKLPPDTDALFAGVPIRQDPSLPLGTVIYHFSDGTTKVHKYELFAPDPLGPKP